MQRSERRQAKKEQRPVKTLTEADYLLGVADANPSRRTSLPLDWQSDARGATPSPVSLPLLNSLLNWAAMASATALARIPRSAFAARTRPRARGFRRHG